MLKVYKYDFYQYDDWTQNWMWQYSNPNLTLSDPKYLYFQTPVSSTINLTLTNNTGSAISNTTSTSQSITPTNNTGYTVQYVSPNYQIGGLSGHYIQRFKITEGVSYTITQNFGTRKVYYGFSTSSTYPSGSPRNLEGGGGTFTTTKTFTAPLTGYCFFSHGPNETTNVDSTVTETTTSYNLILSYLQGDINVDLGQSTLAVNETITVPITLPTSTNSLTFYNNTGGASIQGHWPEISLPYTGWSIRNISDGFIKYRSSGDWT